MSILPHETKALLELLCLPLNTIGSSSHIPSSERITNQGHMIKRMVKIITHSKHVKVFTFRTG